MKTSSHPKSKVSPGKRKQSDPLEEAIEAALAPGNFISNKAAGSFMDDVQDVANAIEKIIGKAPERAARLFETFIAACHEKAEEIDDSSGDLGMLVEDLFRGWIKTRQAADYDPDETAKILLAWIERGLKIARSDSRRSFDELGVGVRHMSPFEMLRREKARFILGRQR